MAIPQGTIPKKNSVGPQENIQRNSTHYAPTYSQRAFLPVRQLEYEDGTLELRADALDHEYNEMFNRITEWQPYPYDGTEHLTTICFKVYGNTTLVWFILQFNGYVHPLEIEPGVVLRMPLLAQINEFQREKNSSIGKVVRF